MSPAIFNNLCVLHVSLLLFERSARNIMTGIHPQYITDTAGKQLVVLPITEFNTIMEELDEIEDIRLYDKLKKRMMESTYLSTIT